MDSETTTNPPGNLQDEHKPASPLCFGRRCFLASLILLFLAAALGFGLAPWVERPPGGQLLIALACLGRAGLCFKSRSRPGNK